MIERNVGDGGIYLCGEEVYATLGTAEGWCLTEDTTQVTHHTNVTGCSGTLSTLLKGWGLVSGVVFF